MFIDWIELDDCVISCVIGLLESEQIAPQPLAISLRLGLDLDQAAGGDLSRSIDYASVLEQVTFLAQHGRWQLLESFGVALCRTFLAPPAGGEDRAQVETIEVTLRKPLILAGRAVPGIRLTRTHAWCELQTRQISPDCVADVLQETALTGAYRVHIDGGGAWPIPPGMAVMAVAGELVLNERVILPGDRIGRGVGVVENPGAEPAAVLAVGALLPSAL